MTLLSDQEILLLKNHLQNLKKEKLVLKRVLHNIAKKYQKQYQLLHDIIQYKEDIENYKHQYFIITSHNKEIGNHILSELPHTLQKMSPEISSKTFLSKIKSCLQTNKQQRLPL